MRCCTATIARSRHADLGPLAGGADAIVYRQWMDGLHPMGDFLMDSTLDAAHGEWLYGIGPGCTAESGGTFDAQALPPVRVKEVCESLNGEGNDVHCCIDSICNPDFADIVDCLNPPG